MSKQRVRAIWFYLIVIVASLGLTACGSVEAGIESHLEEPKITAISPTATEGVPVATPLPTEAAQDPPITQEIPVVGWLGYVVSLPEGAQFDDYVVIENTGEFGLEGATPEIQAQIVALRDKEEPGKYANFWGTLVCDVPDYKGCQIQVERIEENSIDVSAYEGWTQYTNQDYGFSFYYPSSWILEDVPEHVVAEGHPLAGNMIELQKGDYLLAIGYKRVGEERIFWTGMPGGDFEDRGSISFFGQEMEKEVLVLDGKSKMITFPFTTVDDVVFAIRLDDRSSDYAVVDLPIEIQEEVDKILSSFELMK